MDVEMPILDGLDATKAIRAIEKGTGAHIPIIALTAHVLKADRERSFRAGMDAFFLIASSIVGLLDSLHS